MHEGDEFGCFGVSPRFLERRAPPSTPRSDAPSGGDLPCKLRLGVDEASARARISARDCPRGLVWAWTTRSRWATLPFCEALPGKTEMLVAASARSAALEVQRVPLPRAWRGPRSRWRRGASEFEVRVAQTRGWTPTGNPRQKTSSIAAPAAENDYSEERHGCHNNASVLVL